MVLVLGFTLGQEFGDNSMAHTQTLDNATLESIASQVGSLYPRLAGDVEKLQQAAELAETFPIWVLGVDDIIAGGNDVAKIARNTGRWHSQIKIGGSVEAAARSIPLGGDETAWQVRQIIEGKYAQELDQEIDWIDANAPGDPEVRILEVPGYQITAFWLVDGENNFVVVATIPANAQFLRKRHLYTSAEFLDTIRKEQFVIGIQP